MSENKRFQKVYLNPDDYKDMEQAAAWTRRHFPWLVRDRRKFCVIDAM